ncbi:MAG TPA: ABC transporter permease, partial [Bradyrhizobium sp.]|uniref:ABC transporter permease n=1 Tax=Bradyrhizobium sp. TaxID=376 RepID=UPI002B474DB3
MELLDRLAQDIRYGSRSLRKTPGFTAAAILVLALGIGANTAIFSVLEGVVLDPLPYPQSERLVALLIYNRSLKHETELSYPDFLDWQRDARSFEKIAAFRTQNFDVASPGMPAHVNGKEVSSSFFGTLGVKLALGRDFLPQEDKIGGTPAAIVSHHLFEERFAGNPAALGRTITLNGADYTIIGVLQPAFRFDNQQADVYTPLGRGDPLYQNDRTVHDIVCIARLRPGVGIAQARAEMNVVQARIDRLHPAQERGLDGYVDSLAHFMVGDVAGSLLLLLGAAGFVLLIACANVANLVLARSAARSREFAVRLAMGASRTQIVRQLVTESLMLSLAGGALGLAVAKWAVHAVIAAVPGGLPRSENIALNIPVLLFAFGVSIIVGVVFGAFPAIKSSKTDINAALKEGGRGSTSAHQRTQGVLVIVQIAVALVLLTGGSLLLRTIRNLWAVNPGFDARNVITFQVGLSRSVTTSPSRVRIAYQQLVERISQIPGVQMAGITALVPLGKAFNEGPFWVGLRQPTSMAEIPRAIYYP